MSEAKKRDYGYGPPTWSMYYRMEGEDDPEDLAARSGVHGPNLVGTKLMPHFYRAPVASGRLVYEENRGPANYDNLVEEAVREQRMLMYSTRNKEYGAHTTGKVKGRSVASPEEQLKEARAVIRDMKTIASIDHTWEIVGARPAAVQNKLVIWDENGAIDPDPTPRIQGTSDRPSSK